jgi:hypothetical protein
MTKNKWYFMEQPKFLTLNYSLFWHKMQRIQKLFVSEAPG